jgi:hypothetical protein
VFRAQSRASTPGGGLTIVLALPASGSFLSRVDGNPVGSKIIGLEDLDVMARRCHVGVGRDDHRRHLEAADRFGMVVPLLHQSADLVQQQRKILGAGRATRW